MHILQSEEKLEINISFSQYIICIRNKKLFYFRISKLEYISEKTDIPIYHIFSSEKDFENILVQNSVSSKTTYDACIYSSEVKTIQKYCFS